MTGNKIKAVIFDMDGVLIDSEMLYLEDLLKFVQTKNPEVTKEDLFGVVGSTAKDTWTIVQDAAAKRAGLGKPQGRVSGKANHL